MRMLDSFLFCSTLIALLVPSACGHSDSAVSAGEHTGGLTALAAGGSGPLGTLRSGGAQAVGGAGTAGDTTELLDTSVAGGSSIDVRPTGGRVNMGSATAASTSVSMGGASVGGSPATGGTDRGASSSRGSVGTGGNQAAGGSSANTLASIPSAVDVLFMIDNSASMADKQDVLATSLPTLLGRLAQPKCVDGTGKVIGQSQLDGTCAQGKPQFKPVRDLHIGIITSSLGDHGGDTLCTPGKPTAFMDAEGNPIPGAPDLNDASHLIGSLTRGKAALAGDSTISTSAHLKLDPLGFLAWGGSTQAPTSSEITSAQHAFADMVRAVAENGCGLESQLESWFRFLIDPVPPIYPITRPDAMAQRLGSDDALLAQRAAFLRPNSIVLIVMLTDENDCSLRDTDVGWVATDTRRTILTGSPACSSNPNDPCCYSCTTSTPPSGCAACPSSEIAPDDGAYQSNLRCWHQKRRFGYDFMYPVSRYVVGLSKPELCPDQTFGDMDCDCTYASSIGVECSAGARRLPNPLYSNVVGIANDGSTVLGNTPGEPRRDNSNVLAAGIIGVPWQDLGYLDANNTLTYIPVTHPAWNAASATNVAPVTPAPNGIWSLIYGDDAANIVPGDIHMVESLDPRPGLPGPSAAATADPISGHEWNTAFVDLQYACVFALPTPKPCACDQNQTDYASCKYTHPNDCCDLSYSVDGRGTAGSGGDFAKPLCQGRTQVAAKAYPGLREIAVLRDYALGASYSNPAVRGNSIVTSICPKDMSGDSNNAGFGYNPATDAIVSRLAERLPQD